MKKMKTEIRNNLYVIFISFVYFILFSSLSFLAVYLVELMLNVLRCHLTHQGQVVTNAEARFNT